MRAITAELFTADRAAGGLAADLGLYAASAAYAGITAVTATLPPHAAWGRVAFFGYAAASVLVVGQLAARRAGRPRPADGEATGLADRRAGERTGGEATRPGDEGTGPPIGTRLADWRARAVLTALVWVATTLVPLVAQAMARAGGRADRAQEEVLVVEHGGQRLLDTGSPYLGRAAIAALPTDDRLLGYLPYQPGMALFGLPRAALGSAWFTDARVWFALVTAVTVGLACWLARRAGAPCPGVVRAFQAATVLPVCALTLAVGGDDLPVLGLCLLALTCAAIGRYGWAGVAVGLAGAMKLFAWPVALVLLALVLGQASRDGAGSRRVAGMGPVEHPPNQAASRRTVAAYLLGAVGLPVLSLLPAIAVDPGAAWENVVRFPLGRGLVHSPAASPFPGHLIAAGLPGGNAVAAVLLVLAGLGIAGWLVRRPPRHAGSATGVCAAGLLAAILLMPSTRFGYLLYPAAYALWAPTLAAAAIRHPTPGRPAKPAQPRQPADMTVTQG